MPYCRLHYHFIWATADRLPLLHDDAARLVGTVLRSKARRLGLHLHAVGIMPDHVHIALSLPATLAVADCVRHLKGASSRAVNQLITPTRFMWQAEYGALTVGERALPRVADYVRNQAVHHTTASTIAALERIVASTPHRISTSPLQRT